MGKQKKEKIEAGKIHKDDLINKYVTYRDRDGKRRTEKVVNISGNFLTVKNAVKVKHRIYRDRVIGRQLRKRGIQKIQWGK